jgi:hypothetical protein
MKIFKRKLLAINGSMFRIAGMAQLQNTHLVSLALVVADSQFNVPLHKYVFTHILIKICICSPTVFAEQFSGPSVLKLYFTSRS